MLGESETGVVRAAVGMMNHFTVADVAGPDRILERAEDEVVSQRSEHRHPTMRLENASRTAVSQNAPCPHGIRVASATHSRSGPAAVKSRLTRSGAGVAAGFCRVDPIRHFRRR